MKILFVNKFLQPNGGSETYIFKLGEYLQEKGHDVQYFGMEHKDRRVGNNEDVYTKNMDFHGPINIHKIFYPIKIIYNAEARRKMKILLNRIEPDVIHLNNITYHLTPSILLEITKWRKKRKNNCRIIFTAHDYNLICPNHMLKNYKTKKLCEDCLEGDFCNCIKGKCIHGSLIRSVIGALEGYFWNLKNVYKNIDVIICPSEFMKTKMDRNPSFKEKTVVIRNFIEKKEIKEAEKKDYILYFGRYSEEKGILTLLNVCKSLPDIPFVFAGSGPLEKEIDEVSNIRNVGFMTGKELDKLIAEAKISVFPSECYENCPFSVIESQILGTPVIGSRIGGVPELIQDGMTGKLFAAGNEEELKSLINSIFYNEELVAEMTNSCKKAKFEQIEHYYESIMKLYSA